MIFIDSQVGFICLVSAHNESTSLDLTSAGDYILETKPKEISEAQRLNYEQVRVYLFTITFILKECLCFSVCLSKLKTVYGMWSTGF